MWKVTDGLTRLDQSLGTNVSLGDPLALLKHIRISTMRAVYVLADFHNYFSNPVVSRLIKDIVLREDANRPTVILISHALDLPPEIRNYSTKVELALPQKDEIELCMGEQIILKEKAFGKKIEINPEAYSQFLRNLRGLPMDDIRRLISSALTDGSIGPKDVEFVFKSKYELVNRGGLLKLETLPASFEQIAGFTRVKEWIHRRTSAFKSEDHTLDPPKGILLLGVPGCGKSQVCRAIAGYWNIPLLRLDFGSLYSKFYGETERNLREALKVAEAMEPCVLWIDELEKSLATGSSDDGVSSRLLASFLNWLAEKQNNVFVTATANSITSLPPEVIRKGRFDEIFFVDLPSKDLRENLFKIHLQKRKMEIGTLDLKKLAEMTEGFSGAEIEQAIVAALYTAKDNKRDLIPADLEQEIALTRPLSQTMFENIQSTRNWAQDRTASAD